MRSQNLIGCRFGRLVVNELSAPQFDTDGNRRKLWVCTCDCGNKKMVRTHNLTSGRVKSCGCLKHDAYHTTHGLSNTRLFRIWGGMKTRCTNPNVDSYKNYGGRGISVCEEWSRDFENFYIWAMANGYSDSLTLDRIDNNGNYEPSNCRWATYREQRLNNRSVKLLTFNGKTLTQKEWGLELGGGESLIEGRLLRGWTLEKALSTPPRRGKKENT